MAAQVLPFFPAFLLILNAQLLIPYYFFFHITDQRNPCFLSAFPSLGVGEQLLYVRLFLDACKTGFVRVTKKELQEKLGISTPTLNEYLNQLCQLGLVEIYKEPGSFYYHICLKISDTLKAYFDENTDLTQKYDKTLKNMELEARKAYQNSSLAQECSFDEYYQKFAEEEQKRKERSHEAAKKGGQASAAKRKEKASEAPAQTAAAPSPVAPEAPGQAAADPSPVAPEAPGQAAADPSPVAPVAPGQAAADPSPVAPVAPAQAASAQSAEEVAKSEQHNTCIYLFDDISVSGPVGELPIPGVAFAEGSGAVIGSFGFVLNVSGHNPSACPLFVINQHRLRQFVYDPNLTPEDNNVRRQTLEKINILQNFIAHNYEANGFLESFEELGVSLFGADWIHVKMKVFYAETASLKPRAASNVQPEGSSTSHVCCGLNSELVDFVFKNLKEEERREDFLAFIRCYPKAVTEIFSLLSTWKALVQDGSLPSLEILKRSIQDHMLYFWAEDESYRYAPSALRFLKERMWLDVSQHEKESLRRQEAAQRAAQKAQAIAQTPEALAKNEISLKLRKIIDDISEKFSIPRGTVNYVLYFKAHIRDVISSLSDHMSSLPSFTGTFYEWLNSCGFNYSY